MTPLLELRHIRKLFPVQTGLFGRVRDYVHALHDISLQIPSGQTLGLVGESGCGKSTLARIVMRLIQPSAGEIFFAGQAIHRLSEKKLRPLRRQFQMVFQDPYSSLNPRMKIGQILREPLQVHRLGSSQTQRRHVLEMLEKVGLSAEASHKYPHEFSGGQRQRIGIARALMLYPKLVVADEPVSALDVSVQAQIINLLQKLQREMQLTYLFIAHDLKVVRHISQNIAVMYLGHIVEEIPSESLSLARHPYTQALLAAVPRLQAQSKARTAPLSGDIPSPLHPPSGCVFHTRCAHAQEMCRQQIPPLETLAPGHRVACHRAQEIEPFSALKAQDRESGSFLHGGDCGDEEVLRVKT